MGFLPILSAKKLNMNGPTAAPNVTNEDIHEAWSGVIGVSNGLCVKSPPLNLGSIGVDHVKADPEISIAILAEIKAYIKFNVKRVLTKISLTVPCGFRMGKLRFKLSACFVAFVLHVNILYLKSRHMN